MGNYYTVADARSDGITQTEASDDKLNSAIAFAEEFLERCTGRVFYKRPLTLNVDGSGSPALWLMEYRPIVDIESLKIDGSLLDKDFYIIYKIQGYLMLKSSGGDIYAGLSYDRFPKGTQNIEIKGTFGYDWIPSMVRECTKKLVFREIRPKDKIGQYESERISGYSYTLREAGKTKNTGDPEIDKLISLLSDSISNSLQVI